MSVAWERERGTHILCSKVNHTRSGLVFVCHTHQYQCHHCQ